jgi:hypothetical protein
MDPGVIVICVLVIVAVLAVALGNYSVEKEAKRTGETIAEVRERRRRGHNRIEP